MPNHKGFPPGWEIVSLFSERNGTRAVSHNSVRSRDIARADAIIVAHTAPNGFVSHRTVHGAMTKDQVGALVDYLMRADGSPL